MKYKLLSIFCISLILFFVFNAKIAAVENKDNNPEMTDERVIEIIKEISENPEDDEKLYIYHRDYIKDEAYQYLCKMYDIGFYRGRNTQLGESGSGLSNYIYYKIDTNGKFYVKNRDEKNICVQIQFIKSEILAENMPEISDGEVYLELCDDNKWRISKVSQWLDDLAYYDL